MKIQVKQNKIFYGLLLLALVMLIGYTILFIRNQNLEYSRLGDKNVVIPEIEEEMIDKQEEMTVDKKIPAIEEESSSSTKIEFGPSTLDLII